MKKGNDSGRPSRFPLFLSYSRPVSINHAYHINNLVSIETGPEGKRILYVEDREGRAKSKFKESWRYYEKVFYFFGGFFYHYITFCRNIGTNTRPDNDSNSGSAAAQGRLLRSKLTANIYGRWQGLCCVFAKAVSLKPDCLYVCVKTRISKR